MKNVKAGFSLIEVLIVVVIITILSSVVVVQVMDEPGKARIAACKANIQALQTALQMYKGDQARLPTQSQGLAALIEKTVIPPVPRNYPESGYLDTAVIPTDPWGSPFIYLIPGRDGERYEILSYGADGEPGGEDEDADISSSYLQ